MRYRIVTMPTATDRMGVTELTDRAALEVWIAARGMAVVGTCQQRGSIPLPPERLGQPVIDGLMGPLRDGAGVCRYEDRASHDILSV